MMEIVAQNEKPNSKFYLIKKDLNKDSGINKTSKENQLYLYKKIETKITLKTFKLLKGLKEHAMQKVVMTQYLMI